MVHLCVGEIRCRLSGHVRIRISSRPFDARVRILRRSSAGRLRRREEDCGGDGVGRDTALRLISDVEDGMGQGTCMRALL